MPGGFHPPQELLVAWYTDTEKYPRGERRSYSILAGAAVLFFLTVVTVAARLYARIKLQRNAGLDDILITLALFPLVGTDISLVLGLVRFGVDRHAWEVTVDKAVKARIITFSSSVCYILGITLTQASILCFYRRLGSRTVTPFYRWMLRACIAFVLAYGVVFTIMLFVDCNPVSGYWNQMNPDWIKRNPNYHCFDEGADYMASAIISSFQDILACGLPLIIIWQLKMPKRQKIALGAIFSVGWFLCACSIIRAFYMYRTYYLSYDTTWEAYNVWFWSIIEVHFGIICASIPALKLFFSRVLKLSQSGSYFSRKGQKYANFNSDTNRSGNPGARRAGDEESGLHLQNMKKGLQEPVVLALSRPDSEGNDKAEGITVTQELEVFDNRRSRGEDTLYKFDGASQGGSRISRESLLDR